MLLLKPSFSRLQIAFQYTRGLASQLLVAVGLALPMVASVAAQTATAGVGVISYWGTDTALYDHLPAGSTAVFNPDSGILVAAGQTTTLVHDLLTWRTLSDRTASRGVHLLGYVPTGYFNHTCNVLGKCQTWERIEAQVAAYFAQMPSLSGIFFDEAAPSTWNCSAFVTEYQQLRTLVAKYRPGAKIAFNAGVPDTCVVSGALAGETVVLFESSATDYSARAAQIRNATAAARTKGVQTWHLVHSVSTRTDMIKWVNSARQMQTNLIYITHIGGNWRAGENTWGSLPVYWASEIQQIVGLTPGLNLGNMKKKLANYGSYMCLRGTGTRLDQQSCANTTAWTLTVQTVSSMPYYQVRYGTKCAAQPSVGSTVLTWATCSATSASQMWALRQSGSLHYFENRQSAQVLSMPGTTAGSTAIAENYRGAARQLLYFQ